MSPLGKVWTNYLKNHNVISMYPPVNWPLAPSASSCCHQDQRWRRDGCHAEGEQHSYPSSDRWVAIVLSAYSACFSWQVQGLLPFIYSSRQSSCYATWVSSLSITPQVLHGSRSLISMHKRTPCRCTPSWARNWSGTCWRCWGISCQFARCFWRCRWRTFDQISDV